MHLKMHMDKIHLWTHFARIFLKSHIKPREGLLCFEESMGTSGGRLVLKLSAKEVRAGLKKENKKMQKNRKGESAHGAEGNAIARPMDSPEVLAAKLRKPLQLQWVGFEDASSENPFGSVPRPVGESTKFSPFCQNTGREDTCVRAQSYSVL